MKLVIIENRGPDNLRDTLTDLLKRSADVSLAVAFVTTGGLDAILGPLQGVAGRGKVRIVVGLYQCVTEPQALRTLLRLQRSTKGTVSVRLSREPGFHRKVYLLRTRGTLHAITGSSNLTKEGLSSGGELNSLFSMDAKTPSARRIAQVFEDEWSSHHSVPLTQARIEAYAKQRGSQKPSHVLSKQDLRTILGASPRHESADEPSTPIALWQTWIEGGVKESTESWVFQETDWDRRGWDWFAIPVCPRFGTADRLVIFDFHNKSICLASVRSVARRAGPCTDGRHFVAYKELPRSHRRFSETLWDRLREIGITKTAARRHRKLKESQWIALKSLIARR